MLEAMLCEWCFTSIGPSRGISSLLLCLLSHCTGACHEKPLLTKYCYCYYYYYCYYF